MTIEEILKQHHTIAIVGASNNPERYSYIVAHYLQEHGYRIIPVNPQLKELLGESSYPDILSIPHPVDVVDIFRRAEEIPPIVDQAVKIGAKVVWMQEGIVHQEAGAKAEKVGLKVVMDRCMKKEHHRLVK